MAVSVYNTGTRKGLMPKTKKEATADKKPGVLEWWPTNVTGKQLGLQVTARTAQDRTESTKRKSDEIPSD